MKQADSQGKRQRITMGSLVSFLLRSIIAGLASGICVLSQAHHDQSVPGGVLVVKVFLMISWKTVPPSARRPSLRGHRRRCGRAPGALPPGADGTGLVAPPPPQAEEEPGEQPHAEEEDAVTDDA